VSPSVPPQRLALLVATYRYEDAGLRQLTAPGHDAEALAEVLRDPEIATFDVTILTLHGPVGLSDRLCYGVLLVTTKDTRARLLLHSGAFPAGHLSKAGGQVNTVEKFQGKGRVALIASDATQYFFEGNHIISEGTQSVFTRFFVQGLTTGETDLDQRRPKNKKTSRDASSLPETYIGACLPPFTMQS
jgi:hypothetical protein